MFTSVLVFAIQQWLGFERLCQETTCVSKAELSNEREPANLHQMAPLITTTHSVTLWGKVPKW